MDILNKLFASWSGSAPESVTRLTPAGSNREYWRLTANGRSAIGVIGTSADENIAFFTICRQLHSQGLPVPELYVTDDDGMHYLQEDLGDSSLFDVLEPCRKTGIYDSASVGMLRKVMRILPDIQFRGADGMDFTVCYPTPDFDSRSIMWDLNYFKYYFLKPSGIEFHEARLEEDFNRLAGILLQDAPYSTFMYRDFQSRNVMVRDGNPWFIDFQGGRRGPAEYDLVSFLWQARAAYPPELREELIAGYTDSLRRYRETDPDAFRRRLNHFVLFRTMQVLGAYGYRGHFERKPHFLASIPPAMDNLRELLHNGTEFGAYPYLTSLLLKLTELPQYSKPAAEPEKGILTVSISSFSYRKGIPADTSGNGGGFVFDCRSMHNPGLYEEYKQLDGRDQPVIDFLEQQGEIQKFLDNVCGLVDPAVSKYISRGFTHLAVNFGCTGGHHRSVRSAECLAAHLKEKYGNGIRVLLTHHELKSSREL